MAFQNLRAEILDEFSEDERHEDHANEWSAYGRKLRAAKRSAAKSEAVIDDRLRRKRARTLSDRKLRAIPRPIRDVACALCRLEFMTVQGLCHHLRQAHAETAKLWVYWATTSSVVSCRFCRAAFGNSWSMDDHVRVHHQKENRAVSFANRHLAQKQRPLSSRARMPRPLIVVSPHSKKP